MIDVKILYVQWFQKSHIHVTKMSDALSSNCQLAIKGIEPQQQVDLCTDHYTNFTLIGTVDSQSTPQSNSGLVQVASGEFSANQILVHNYIVKLSNS